MQPFADTAELRVGARPARRARLRRAAAAPARPEGAALRAPALERPRGRGPAAAGPCASCDVDTTVAARAAARRVAADEDPLAERVDRLEAGSRRAREPGRRAARRPRRVGPRPRGGGTYGAESTVPCARRRSGRPASSGGVALVAPVGLPRQRAHGVVHVGVVDQPLLAVPQLWIIEYEQSHEVGVRAPGSGTSRIMIRFVPPAIPARPAVITTLAPGASSAKSRAPSSAESISSSTVSACSMRVA